MGSGMSYSVEDAKSEYKTMLIERLIFTSNRVIVVISSLIEQQDLVEIKSRESKAEHQQFLRMTLLLVVL